LKNNAEGKDTAAAIPAQLLLLRCRNKKQWAKNHFERFRNDKNFHDIFFTTTERKPSENSSNKNDLKSKPTPRNKTLTRFEIFKPPLAQTQINIFANSFLFLFRATSSDLSNN